MNAHGVREVSRVNHGLQGWDHRVHIIVLLCVGDDVYAIPLGVLDHLQVKLQRWLLVGSTNDRSNGVGEGAQSVAKVEARERV